MYEFDWSSIVPSLPYLLDGLVITLKITVTAVVIGILWGTMLAVMRLSSFAPVAWFAKAYVNVFRSIPLVMRPTIQRLSVLVFKVFLVVNRAPRWRWE